MVRSHADDVKAAALETIGNLAFCKENSRTLRASPGLHDRLCLLSASQPGVIHQSVRMAAIRSLAILGEALMANCGCVANLNASGSWIEHMSMSNSPAEFAISRPSIDSHLPSAGYIQIFHLEWLFKEH